VRSDRHAVASSGIIFLARSVGIAAFSRFETLTKKNQELVRRSKAQLPSRVDFLDPAFEMMSSSLRIWSQPQDECPPHHDATLRQQDRQRREKSVQFSVNVRVVGGC
jgi:hypothetical protein